MNNNISRKSPDKNSLSLIEKGFGAKLNGVLFGVSLLVSSLTVQGDWLDKENFIGGANIIDDSKSSLLVAIKISDQEKRLELIKQLLDDGADPNQVDDDGTPLLHQAINEGRGKQTEYKTQFVGSVRNIKGYLETIVLLLKYGGDINIKDNSKKTPLMCSIKNRELDIAKFLVINGASQIVDEYGRKNIFDYVRSYNFGGLGNDFIRFLKEYKEKCKYRLYPHSKVTDITQRKINLQIETITSFKDGNEVFDKEELRIYCPDFNY